MSAVDLLTTQLEVLKTPAADLSDLMVSKKSCVYDLTWDFTDDLIHRPRSITDAKLQINWEKWPFSTSLRRELQHIFALYRKAPNTLSKGSREIKAHTFVGYVEVSLNFLCAALESFASADLFDSLDQVTLTDLQQAAKARPGSGPAIKRGLRILFHPFAGEVLNKRFNVTQDDIKNLSLRMYTRRLAQNLDEDFGGTPILSDELFGFLSDEATGRVKDFLRRIGGDIEDELNYRYEAPPGIPSSSEFGKTLYMYEQMRRRRKSLPYDDMGIGSAIRHHLRKIVQPALLSNYLTEVNWAAQCVIALYIGPRFSEIASLEVGCMTQRDGIWCIVGRNFKGKHDKNVSDDSWVAIPAVRDAVRVLERLACIKNNRFLIASLQTADGVSRCSETVRNSGVSYCPRGFSWAMSEFLRIVDTQGRYAGWKLNNHQFKHSLTHQLIRAKLGLPYISFHLKHLHRRISTLPSEVTLGYGNAGSTYQSEMAGHQIQEVKRDLARKMYDPNSPIHGGAAPEFDRRRKSYFKGMTDSGVSKEQIIDELASLGDSAFVNVGLGYCTGRKDDPATGEKPPCIGSLRCNPSKCGNAIITKEAHGAAWQRIAIENRSMEADPRFAYGQAQFMAAAEEAEEVCRRLGMEVDNG